MSSLDIGATAGRLKYISGRGVTGYAMKSGGCRVHGPNGELTREPRRWSYAWVYRVRVQRGWYLHNMVLARRLL